MTQPYSVALMFSDDVLSEIQRRHPGLDIKTDVLKELPSRGDMLRFEKVLDGIAFAVQMREFVLMADDQFVIRLWLEKVPGSGGIKH